MERTAPAKGAVCIYEKAAVCINQHNFEFLGTNKAQLS